MEGARQGGATGIVVADEHGNSENLLLELFLPEVPNVRGAPTHLGMMRGLDTSFDAVMFIGYHASTHNMNGVRAHTFSSGQLTRVALNGVPATESSWNAAIAEQFGIPVIFMSGTTPRLPRSRRRLAVSKRHKPSAMGIHAAETLTVAAAQKLIRDRATVAVTRLTNRKPDVVTKL